MRLAILLLSAAAVWAQSGLNAPFLGNMIDRQGLLRPVYGLSGNFIVQSPVSSDRIFASACSAVLCLAKTERSLVSGNLVTPAPPGGAVIAPDSTGAMVYFPSTRQFARWQNGVLTKLGANPTLPAGATLVSMANGPSGLVFAVEQAGAISILSASGGLIDTLPAQAGAVLLLPTLTVYATAGSMVLRKSDGTEFDFPAPGVVSFHALGNGYIEGVAGGVLYALRTTSGRETLFQLPGVAP